jgi:2-amino-4-hydroxy-6-hydroxymethyldihydropteridine diphosphokinase
VTHVLLSLGSNTGDSTENLKLAIANVNALDMTEVIAVSSVHKTAPWGKTDQPDFLNQSVLVATDLNVAELMENILQIEKDMGRVREEKWGPRLIDIDIILFGEETISTPELTIPHPHMHERRFVLEPSVEIAGHMIHPVIKKSVSELLLMCELNTSQ